MRVIVSYLIAMSVVSLCLRLSRPGFEVTLYEVDQTIAPVDIAPDLRRHTLKAGLLAGLLCGLVFVYVGQSSPLMHAFIFLSVNLAIGLVLCRLTRVDSVSVDIMLNATARPQWVEHAFAVLPFALALLLSTLLAEAISK